MCSEDFDFERGRSGRKGTMRPVYKNGFYYDRG